MLDFCQNLLYQSFMLRAGRFRHRLLDDNFLSTHSLLAEECLTPFLSLWRAQKVSDQEIVAIYILIFCFLRSPKNFLGGPHNTKIISSFQSENATFSSRDILQLFKATLDKHDFPITPCLRRLDSDESFVSLFCRHSWRSLPLAVQASIAQWTHGNYPLILLTHLPSPLDVLKLQCSGKRCVSMMVDTESLLDVIDEGRDCLGFIVHDLIHAHHFFQDSQQAHAQIDFCKKLLWLYEHEPMLAKWMELDSEFQKEFEYIMSDMNSVPLHLIKTLKAIVLGSFKRQNGFSLKDQLDSEKNQEFQEIFIRFLTPWSFPANTLDAALRLNTKNALAEVDDLLLSKALFHFL